MKRVIIGNRGADTGLWISKPGKDAASTVDDDMLVSPLRYLVQPYLQGRIYSDGSFKVSTTITHNLGYIPVVEVFGAPAPVGTVTTTALRFAQQTTANIVYDSDDNVYYLRGVQGAPPGPHYYAIDVTYVIFRTKLAAS